jgi:nucleotide-binding universal stress UspA family protein
VPTRAPQPLPPADQRIVVGVDGSPASVDAPRWAARQADLTGGHPVEVLLAAAHGADLLVVGSRGHAALAGRLLWSVSEHIAARATCRVVVIRRTPGPTTPRRPPQIAGSGREVMSGAGFR